MRHGHGSSFPELGTQPSAWLLMGLVLLPSPGRGVLLLFPFYRGGDLEVASQLEVLARGFKLRGPSSCALLEFSVALAVPCLMQAHFEDGVGSRLAAITGEAEGGPGRGRSLTTRPWDPPRTASESRGFRVLRRSLRMPLFGGDTVGGESRGGSPANGRPKGGGTGGEQLGRHPLPTGPLWSLQPNQKLAQRFGYKHPAGSSMPSAPGGE